MKAITKWFYRNFCVISAHKAKKLGLVRYRGVYGDQINKLNCRSIWIDSKDRYYRVAELEDTSKQVTQK